MIHRSFRSPAVVGLLFISSVLAGCGATSYKPDPKIVASYVAPSTPRSDETFVYVIRGGNFMGAARSVWVAANDRVVGSLDNSTHTFVKLKSGVNTVHMVQGLAGFGFVAVDNRPGETVFLSLDYAKGLIQEVPRDLGITMLAKTNPMDVLAETRENTGFEEGLLNPGRLGLSFMGPATERLAADQGTALITFFRSDKLIQEVPFDLWDESGYVGSLKGGQYLQVQVKPGRHTYFAKSERYSVLNADVIAGKSYFVEYDIDMGWNMAHIQLLPRDATKDGKELTKQTALLSQVSVDPAKLNTPNVKMRIDAGSTYLDDARRKAQSGELPARELTSGMGM